MKVLVFCLFYGVVSGCGVKAGKGPKQFVKETANFQFIKKIAILPFNNMSDDKYAGEKIKNAVLMEVLERGLFEVAEEGEVNKVIAEVFREMGFAEGDLVSLDIETVQRIAERLETQALFIGTVESYGLDRTSGTPQAMVSLSLRLVDAKSGVTLWRAFHSEKGSSLWRRILGVEQKDELVLTQEIARKLLDTLFGS